MTLQKQTSTNEKTLRRDHLGEDEIRLRAYELYEQRGRENGRDVDDWLQAESELNTQQRKAKAA